MIGPGPQGRLSFDAVVLAMHEGERVTDLRRSQRTLTVTIVGEVRQEESLDVPIVLNSGSRTYCGLNPFSNASQSRALVGCPAC